MTIERLRLRRFTAFDELDFDPSCGINVLVGANGTGKTHLMKVAYAACDVSRTGSSFAEKLARVFMPSGGSVGRLARRQGENAGCGIGIARGGAELRLSFSSRTGEAASARVTGASRWKAAPVESAYVPVEETLADAPGFRSLYAERELRFDEIRDDIVTRACKPASGGPIDRQRGRLLAALQGTIGGEVAVTNEEFFLRTGEGDLEFALLAEGTRKLGLLWLLIRNGTLPDGSVLFWDEPETNLNPGLFGSVVGAFLELQRMGVQIFAATHAYAILKELDLQARPGDEIAYHSLHRESDAGGVVCRSSRSYLDIYPNAIAAAFTDLYDREVERSLKGSR